MEEPSINSENNINRTAGNQIKKSDVLSATTCTIDEAYAWQKATGRTGVPKGVYRFKTHEEADEWLCKMITFRMAEEKNRP